MDSIGLVCLFLIAKVFQWLGIYIGFRLGVCSGWSLFIVILLVVMILELSVVRLSVWIHDFDVYDIVESEASRVVCL